MKNNTIRIQKKGDRLAALSVVLFMIFIVWVIYFKLGRMDLIRAAFSRVGHLNLKERFLFDIEPFVFDRNPPVERKDALLNCFALLPLGILLPFADGKIRPLKHLSLCFLFSLAVEVTQLFTRIGGFATDDLITNTVGCLLGFPLYLLLRCLPSRVKTAALAVTAVLLGGMIVYAAVTLIPILPEIVALTRTPIPAP